jgi:hypothetical protein
MPQNVLRTGEWSYLSLDVKIRQSYMNMLEIQLRRGGQTQFLPPQRGSAIGRKGSASAFRSYPRLIEPATAFIERNPSSALPACTENDPLSGQPAQSDAQHDRRKNAGHHIVDHHAHATLHAPVQPADRPRLPHVEQAEQHEAGEQHPPRETAGG